MANGRAGVREMAELGMPIFLDLKFHDIPNTVAKAIMALRPLEPAILTVHAAGGRAMLEDAKAAAPTGTKVVAVTTLTSLDGTDLASISCPDNPHDQVLRLTDLAMRAGVDGVVCSGDEVAAALKYVPKLGFEKIMAHFKTAGSNDNGWLFTTKAGLYGTDYLERAFITAIGLGANRPKDAVYPTSEADANGKRRLDDARDTVRKEVATALANGMRVFPVLVGGAKMPAEEDLPEELQSLARRHALEITEQDFDEDVIKLSRALERALGWTPKPEPGHKSPSAMAAAAVAAAVVVVAVVAYLAMRNPAPVANPQTAAGNDQPVKPPVNTILPPDDRKAGKQVVEREPPPPAPKRETGPVRQAPRRGGPAPVAEPVADVSATTPQLTGEAGLFERKRACEGEND